MRIGDGQLSAKETPAFQIFRDEGVFDHSDDRGCRKFVDNVDDLVAGSVVIEVVVDSEM